MQPIANNVWIKRYSLNLMGGHQDRVVTVIRLISGRLIIHSTAPFTDADVFEIRSLGYPGWITDPMLYHDTFAKQGQAAFPDIPYLVPAGFSDSAQIIGSPLLPPPREWSPEVKVLLIAGMPKAKEHVFLHVPSRTLIVADLVFNFGPSSGWTWFMRNILMGVKTHPDSARVYPFLVEDRTAYDYSINELLTWDFDQIVVGHNELIETGGKSRLKLALKNKGMLPNSAY